MALPEPDLVFTFKHITSTYNPAPTISLTVTRNIDEEVVATCVRQAAPFDSLDEMLAFLVEEVRARQLKLF